ncbi:hypothetical protein [Acidisoma sp. C75]
MSGEMLRLARIAFELAFNPARLADAAASQAKRMLVFAIAGTAAGFVLLPALGCAAAGLWIFVQHRLGPVWAAFITAAALAIIAIIILLAGLLAMRERGGARRRHLAERQGGGGPRPLDQLGAVLPALIGFLAARREAAAERGKAAASDVRARSHGFFARHKGAFVLAALAAGLVLGQDILRPRRRPRRD